MVEGLDLLSLPLVKKLLKHSTSTLGNEIHVNTLYINIRTCDSQSLCVHVWLVFSQIAPLECLFELHSFSTLF